MTNNQKLMLLHESRMWITGVVIPLCILGYFCEKEFHISQKIKNKWNKRKNNKKLKENYKNGI